MSALAAMLGTRHALIQAPMAGTQGPKLAIACSSAGALGSIPAAAVSLETLAAHLAHMQSSALPYNVNFFCHQPTPIDEAQHRAYQAVLAPFYAEFGIDAARIAPASGREPFSEAACALIEQFRPQVVSFHFGLPTDALLARVRATGAQVLSSATTLAEALWLQARGVDAVIAQGNEAGGHRGVFLENWRTAWPKQPGTLALVAQCAHSLRIPVIAAGGISDARSVRAALALGAAGVQVGSAFLLAHEADTSPVHRAALRSSAAHPEEHQTALTNLFTGRPARGIVNRVMREIGPINWAAPEFAQATAAIAPLRSAAEAQSSGDFSPLWCGQNIAGCRETDAASIVSSLIV
jgi:nitronate monooxygenase